MKTSKDGLFKVSKEGFHTPISPGAMLKLSMMKLARFTRERDGLPPIAKEIGDMQKSLSASEFKALVMSKKVKQKSLKRSVTFTFEDGSELTFERR